MLNSLLYVLALNEPVDFNLYKESLMETPFTKQIGIWVEQIQQLDKEIDIEKADPELFEAFKAFALRLDETVTSLSS